MSDSESYQRGELLERLQALEALDGIVRQVELRQVDQRHQRVADPTQTVRLHVQPAERLGQVLDVLNHLDLHSRHRGQGTSEVRDWPFFTARD
jgi:hypothetical protein